MSEGDMSGPIRVSSDGMSQLGDSLATATIRIGDLLDELDGRVALLRSAWDGEAQEAYTVAHEEWMRSRTAGKEVWAARGRDGGGSGVGAPKAWWSEMIMAGAGR